MSRLQTIGEPASPMLDVIFVHGLGGNALDTWRAPTGAYWPSLLAEHRSDIRVLVLDYDASPTAWFSAAMPLTDRAINVLARLAADDVGTSPVIFVCHSLGGLLVKKLLHHASTFAREYGGILSATRGVLFLATPHAGSNLATLVDGLKILTRSTIAVQELSAHAPQLRELNVWYRNNVDALSLKHRVFFETQKSAGLALVVDPSSADPGLAGVTPVAIDADHFAICKPGDATAIVHRELCRFINEIIAMDAVADSGTAAAATPVSVASVGSTASELERYQVGATVYTGTYSTVKKCIIRETGERRILKATNSSFVSVAALTALSELKCDGLASPRRVWEDGNIVYEELPYVGGIRLSEALISGVGGMSGKLLEYFHEEMMTLLGELHSINVIHRDIHPENIYLVAEAIDEQQLQRYDEAKHEHSTLVGYRDSVLRLRVVIVDHTFSILEKEAGSARPVVHGTYTPEEQALGFPSKASDMYAFGATLYAAITGKSLPAPSERRARRGPISNLPRGDHSSRAFTHHLADLLALDEGRRPHAPFYLVCDTWVPRHSGSIRLSDSRILVDSKSGPRILEQAEALPYFLAAREEEGSQPDIDYWIRELS